MTKYARVCRDQCSSICNNNKIKIGFLLATIEGSNIIQTLFDCIIIDLLLKFIHSCKSDYHDLISKSHCGGAKVRLKVVVSGWFSSDPMEFKPCMVITCMNDMTLACIFKGDN